MPQAMLDVGGKGLVHSARAPGAWEERRSQSRLPASGGIRPHEEIPKGPWAGVRLGRRGRVMRAAIT